MAVKVETTPGSVVHKGHEQIAGLSAAKSLTVPDGSSFAMIRPKTQGVWVTGDDTTPSSTNGFPVYANETLVCTVNLRRVKIIEQAASATVDVWYCGQD